MARFDSNRNGSIAAQQRSLLAEGISLGFLTVWHLHSPTFQEFRTSSEGKQFREKPQNLLWEMKTRS